MQQIYYKTWTSDIVIYFTHQMALHNATKLLPLTSQTKLTLTVTLTPTETVILIYMHTSLTPIKRFFRIYKRSFSLRWVAWVVTFSHLLLPLEPHWAGGSLSSHD